MVVGRQQFGVPQRRIPILLFFSLLRWAHPTVAAVVAAVGVGVVVVIGGGGGVVVVVVVFVVVVFVGADQLANEGEGNKEVIEIRVREGVEPIGAESPQRRCFAVARASENRARQTNNKGGGEEEERKPARMPAKAGLSSLRRICHSLANEDSGSAATVAGRGGIEEGCGDDEDDDDDEGSDRDGDSAGDEGGDADVEINILVARSTQSFLNADITPSQSPFLL